MKLQSLQLKIRQQLSLENKKVWSAARATSSRSSKSSSNAWQGGAGGSGDPQAPHACRQPRTAHQLPWHFTPSSVAFFQGIPLQALFWDVSSTPPPP